MSGDRPVEPDIRAESLSLSPDGTVLSSHGTLLAAVGIDAGEILGRPLLAGLAGSAPGTPCGTADLLDAALEHGAARVRVRLRRSEDRSSWADVIVFAPSGAGTWTATLVERPTSGLGHPSEAEAPFRQFFDRTLTAFAIVRPDGLTLDVNQTALELTGYTRDEVVGRPFAETPFWEGDPERVRHVEQLVPARPAASRARTAAPFGVPTARRVTESECTGRCTGKTVPSDA